MSICIKFFHIITLLLFFALPSDAKATVIEFSDDGTITKFEAIDYLGKQRHLRFKNFSFKKDYEEIVAKYSSIYGVNPDLVHAVIKVESSYIADAVSPKGAQGLMQLMPETAKGYNVSNSLNAEENIKGGVHLLSDLLKKYDGDLKLVLAAYNAGEQAVKKYNGVPPYKETIDYIEKIESILKK